MASLSSGILIQLLAFYCLSGSLIKHSDIVWLNGTQENSHMVELMGTPEGALFRVHRGSERVVIQPFEFSYLDLNHIGIAELNGHHYLIGVWMTGQRARALSVTDLRGDLKKTVYVIDSTSEMSFNIKNSHVEIFYSTVTSEDEDEGIIKAIWQPLSSK